MIEKELPKISSKTPVSDGKLRILSIEAGAGQKK